MSTIWELAHVTNATMKDFNILWKQTHDFLGRSSSPGISDDIIGCFIKLNFNSLIQDSRFVGFMLGDNNIDIRSNVEYDNLIQGHKSRITTYLTPKHQKLFFKKMGDEFKRELVARHLKLISTRSSMGFGFMIFSLYYFIQIVPSDMTKDEWAKWSRRLKSQIRQIYMDYPKSYGEVEPVDIYPNTSKLSFGKIGPQFAKYVLQCPNLSTYFTITDKVKMEVELTL